MNKRLEKINWFDFAIVLFVALIFSWLFFLSFSILVDGDEKEHLYASYLISKGDIPYRDFFEHHHPLLWYLFAPIVLMFSNNENVLYIMRLFVFFVMLGQLVYIYKIYDLINKNKILALLSVGVYLSFIPIQTKSILFRPDSLMVLFGLAGFYYYLKYIELKDRKFIVLSFLLFLFSFMTLQKILLLFLPLGMLMVWHMKEKQFKMGDFFVALGFILLLLALYVFYLYRNDALKDFFETTWLLNLKIRYKYSLVSLMDWLMILVGGGFCLWELLFSNNKKMKEIAFLGVVLAISFIVLRPSYTHYFFVIYPCFAIIITNVLFRFFGKKIVFFVFIDVLFVLVKLVNGVHVYPKYPYNFAEYVKKERIILLNSDADDYFIGCEDLVYGTSLRRNIAGYYWFSYVQMSQLDYAYFKRKELPDLNEIITIKKPKIVCGGDWGYCLDDNLYMKTPCVTWQYLDVEKLKENYSKIGTVWFRRE